PLRAAPAFAVSSKSSSCASRWSSRLMSPRRTSVELRLARGRFGFGLSGMISSLPRSRVGLGTGPAGHRQIYPIRADGASREPDERCYSTGTMTDPSVFRDLAYVMVAAVLGGALAWWARQPLILGYVLGG